MKCARKILIIQMHIYTRAYSKNRFSILFVTIVIILSSKIIKYNY